MAHDFSRLSEKPADYAAKTLASYRLGMRAGGSIVGVVVQTSERLLWRGPSTATRGDLSPRRCAPPAATRLPGSKPMPVRLPPEDDLSKGTEMIALVTGATGFIGGSLAESLSESGWEVRVLVRASSRRRGRWSERYRVFEADLDGSLAVLEEAVAGCDLVFHAAAIRDRWGTSPEQYRRVNVEGTRRLLAATAGRAPRFVYISSVGVLGWPGVDGIDESFPINVRPGEIDYHGTKAAAEQLVHAMGRRMSTVVVRPTITYGPGDKDGMLTRLIRLIARGRFVRIGRGDNRLHLTYIEDLVQGLILAGTSPSASGETFHSCRAHFHPDARAH